MKSPVQIRVAAPKSPDFEWNQDFFFWKSYEILDNISSENGEIRAEAAQIVE